MREFHVMRGTLKMVYPFETYITVFEDTGGPNEKRLKKYFQKVLRHGTDDPTGKGSVSQQKKLMIDIEVCDTDLQEYAFAADYDGLGKGQHERVQEHLHEHDEFTFATEVPVWSTPFELAGKYNDFDWDCVYCARDQAQCDDCSDELCRKHIKCSHLLHGHIDVLRVLPDDIIEVADFKPKAEKERKAASQVWRYMSLLSMRTGISTKDMRGVYFDANYSYKLIK